MLAGIRLSSDVLPVETCPALTLDARSHLVDIRLQQAEH